MQRRLEQIYLEHRQGLYTMALAITRCAAAAEDAVQEGFARLWASGRPPQGDGVAYVFASVRNAAIDLWRRHRPAAERQQEMPVSIFDGQEADPATAAMTAEQVERLGRAVDALPDDQRDVVVMRAYGGLTYAQIAKALGEPLPTVAGRYRQALERLRSQMGDDHER
jgi:RNA polymerase sigma-70 factor (ECF subfamily)